MHSYCVISMDDLLPINYFPDFVQILLLVASIVHLVSMLRDIDDQDRDFVRLKNPILLGCYLHLQFLSILVVYKPAPTGCSGKLHSFVVELINHHVIRSKSIGDDLG